MCCGSLRKQGNNSIWIINSVNIIKIHLRMCWRGRRRLVYTESIFVTSCSGFFSVHSLSHHVLRTPMVFMLMCCDQNCVWNGGLWRFAIEALVLILDYSWWAGLFKLFFLFFVWDLWDLGFLEHTQCPVSLLGSLRQNSESHSPLVFPFLEYFMAPDLFFSLLP